MQVTEELGIDNLKIIQDDELYRFTSDSVLLSKFVKPKKGDVVADFCAGSGIVGIHTYAINNFLTDITLFEMQEQLSRLSEMSVKLNNLEDKIKIKNMRLQDIDNSYNEKFSLILCNPPYEKKDSGINIPQEHIAVCKKELTITLEEIIQIASKKLKFKGKLAIINKCERLVEIFALMRKYNIEPKRMQIVYGANSPYLVMVEGVKGGNCGIKIEDAIKN